jgi:glutamate formiminotransferase
VCYLIAFVGNPQAVIEAAMAAARSAYNLIDMTRHNGEHPRIGAMVNKKFFQIFFLKNYLSGCCTICTCSKCNNG